MGEVIQQVQRDLHPLAQVLHRLGDLLLGPVVVDLKGLGQNGPDRFPGVERGVGVLEDDLHLLAQGQSLFPVRREDVLSPVEQLSVAALEQTHDDIAHRALAAAALTHQTQRLAGIDVEADVVHRVQGLFLGDFEVLLQMLRLDQRHLLVGCLRALHHNPSFAQKHAA